MLSFSFWVAFALVFFGLKWLSEAWLTALGSRRPASSSSRQPRPTGGDPSRVPSNDIVRKAA